MQVPIVVMGAAGRMGSTIARLARKDSALFLAGRVAHEARIPELLPDTASVDGSDLEAVLDAIAARPVIVDFTLPSFSLQTARAAARRGLAHVIGTTGFSDPDLAELRTLAQKTPLLWSPNMSVGVTVLQKILPELVRLLGDQYDMELVEIHHNRKKDSPSGTAMRLAEAMVQARGWSMAESACYHREGMIGERPHREMCLHAVRGGDVVGVHTAYFLGPGERIEVTHHAHSRENFARGALRAAKWLAGHKPGKLYAMDDVL